MSDQYRRLTFNGDDDLYLHPVYGARTLENIKYMDEVSRTPIKETINRYFTNCEMSSEMSIRCERFIDAHGFSLH